MSMTKEQLLVELSKGSKLILGEFYGSTLYQVQLKDTDLSVMLEKSVAEGVVKKLQLKKKKLKRDKTVDGMTFYQYN